MRFAPLVLVFFSLALALTAAPAPDRPALRAQTTHSWQPLFDGKSLAGWKVTDFIGHAGVRWQNEQIVLEEGSDLTGITWTNPLPRAPYEISLQAMKLKGDDFFCGLTFPVGEGFCTFIVGGWGGGIVGLSSIDNMDASENETSRTLHFETNRWYQIRVRVLPSRIQAWIDDEPMVDLATAGRKISMRWGEIDLSRPLGIASWRTTAALRDLRVRSLPEQSVKTIVLVAGRKSHGPGEHEYEKGLALLRTCLSRADNFTPVRAELYLKGWPDNETALNEADSIVLYCDGADRDEKAHPLLADGRLKMLGKAMERGAGLVAIHYTLFVPQERGGKEFLNWLGGFFDYETGPGSNHWYSRIETRDFAVAPGKGEHPILRGVPPFSLKEEFYFRLRFNNSASGWAPILGFAGDQPPPENVVAWAFERPGGGRGFGYSGGHFHKNWDLPAVRKMMLNAILWSAQIEVPTQGAQCEVSLTP